jgi:hypothetical protein
MRTEIGSTSTTKSLPVATGAPAEQPAAFVHNMGAGIMASITALSSLLGIPVIDIANLDEPRALEALLPFETVVFQGWNPRFRSLTDRLPPSKRVLAHWHTGISGVETMGEGEILADVLACPRVEALLWTHTEFSDLEHPRIVVFPNVAMRSQFRWILDAPRAELDPASIHVLLPTINRPVKNGLTAAFAASMAARELPVVLHTTQAFGAGQRCGTLLRHLFGERLVVHPPLPVRAPRWGSIIKSATLTMHLSFSESYCYALIESLVAGVPAVVSRAIPMAEWLRQDSGVACTVVDPHDVKSTAKAIVDIGRRSPDERTDLAVRQLEAFRRYNRACAEALLLRCVQLQLIDVRAASRGLADLV